MSYKKFLVLLLFVCVVSCFCGCTKRDKLTNNTMILQIEPSTDISCSVGDTYPMKSVIRNVGKGEVDEPVRWSVVPADLGVFDSTASKKVVFLAKQSGSGKIYLSCQGVVTSINVTVS